MGPGQFITTVTDALGCAATLVTDYPHGRKRSGADERGEHDGLLRRTGRREKDRERWL